MAFHASAHPEHFAELAEALMPPPTTSAPSDLALCIPPSAFTFLEPRLRRGHEHPRVSLRVQLPRAGAFFSLVSRSWCCGVAALTLSLSPSLDAPTREERGKGSTHGNHHLRNCALPLADWRHSLREACGPLVKLAAVRLRCRSVAVFTSSDRKSVV